jgi:hypothetical protein
MRRRDLLMWPVSVALAIAAGLLVLRLNPGNLLRPCPLRTLTGIPCPTCGGTGAFRELLAGRLGAALLSNPLVAAGMLLGIATALACLIALPWADRVRRPRTPSGRILGLLLLVAVIANWIYLIIRSRG